MPKSYEAFFSYASENKEFADRMVDSLKFNGMSIWYAPLELQPGDNLLISLERGMNFSDCGILLISREYLTKNWTGFEIDNLITQYIEDGKKIIPIWLNVTKEDIKKTRPSLANIVALDANDNFDKIIGQIVKVLSKNAKTILLTPSYEDPTHKFLTKTGEMHINNDDGKATTLWEFLIYAKDDEYPVYVNGALYQKQDFLFYASQCMSSFKDEILHFINKEDYDKIWEMCVDNGLDPSIY